MTDADRSWQLDIMGMEEHFAFARSFLRRPVD